MVKTASRHQPPPVHLNVVLKLPDKPEKEYSYEFRQPVISMGRDPNNDIQIPLTTVSRNHARIFYEMGDFFLEDLGSTHGTEHNRRPVPKGEKRLLRDGDHIQVMSFHITFKTTAGTPLDRQPGEKTEQLARRMVQEVLSSLGDDHGEPPALRIMNGVDEGKRYELLEDTTEIVLGRSPECDVVLNDHNVSRRHCLIKRDWHGFTAQDLGSKNGVVLNGQPTEGHQLLRDGDEIQIGGVKLTFIDPPSRLLDKMGGIENATMDPESLKEAEAPVEDAPPVDAADLEENYEDPGPSLLEEDPIPDDLEDMAEEDEAGLPVSVEIPDELKNVGKKGALEVVILLMGGLFLLVVIFLVALLVW